MENNTGRDNTGNTVEDVCEDVDQIDTNNQVENQKLERITRWC